MKTAKQAQAKLRCYANPKRAQAQQKYYRTEKGGYGEGDRFIGATVPQVREVAKEFFELSLVELGLLLRSKIHEDRLLALVIIAGRFRKAGERERTGLFKLYVKERRAINSWDLVDVSAPHVSGPYLYDRDRQILFRFARSKNLWDRRIAMVSTFYFIRQNDFKDALVLAEILRDDEHDLMHKAVGWMLREIGNRNLQILEGFLERHGDRMPRTMLRYAIEKMTPAKRRYFLGLRSSRSAR